MPLVAVPLGLLCALNQILTKAEFPNSLVQVVQYNITSKKHALPLVLSQPSAMFLFSHLFCKGVEKSVK